MLVVEVKDEDHLIVIHYTGENGLTMKNSVKAMSYSVAGIPYKECVVKEEDVYLDVNKDTVELLEYLEEVEKYKGDAAIERGRGKVGERKYDALSNNCESLANWIFTDKNQTNQGDKASQVRVDVGVGLGLAVDALAAAGYGVCKALTPIKKIDSDDK